MCFSFDVETVGRWTDEQLEHMRDRYIAGAESRRYDQYIKSGYMQDLQEVEKAIAYRQAEKRAVQITITADVEATLAEASAALKDASPARVRVHSNRRPRVKV